MKKVVLLILLIFISCRGGIGGVAKKSSEAVDCNGAAGGNAMLDDCGVCDDDSSNDCLDCINEFNIVITSQLQAFYVFQNVTINEAPLDSNDWVGAYNGEICVGARQWNTSLCGGGICDVPAFGYDPLISETSGYCRSGDIPTFKIYDVSENIVYNTTTTDEINPFSNNNMQVISILESTISAPCK